VKKLKNDRKAIEIITPTEVRLLFPRQWETVWGDDRISYLGNKLAACTGMRASEILGLRGLSMHSWRHFFNTTLQMANVALRKVQSVTGHKSDRMTEWCTHFDAKEFAEVRGVQEALLLPENPGGNVETGVKVLETDNH
jgi:integrase